MTKWALDNPLSPEKFPRKDSARNAAPSSFNQKGKETNRMSWLKRFLGIIGKRHFRTIVSVHPPPPPMKRRIVMELNTMSPASHCCSFRLNRASKKTYLQGRRSSPMHRFTQTSSSASWRLLILRASPNRGVTVCILFIFICAIWLGRP